MKELIEIQKKLKAPKSQTNSFGNYKYRSCEDILEAVKPLAVELGAQLTLTDAMVEVGGRIYVKATANIETKEGTVFVCAYAREAENKKGMDDAQVTGAASSYARKYALNGLFLIDDTRDADTQDNSPIVNKIEYIDKKQLSTIKDYVDNTEGFEARLLKYLKVDSLDEIVKTDYQKAIKAMEAHK